MWTLLKITSGLARNQKAATAVEYALILGLIVVALIAAFTMLADTTITMWNGVSNEVKSAG
jgi:pilus assembly protein Flp/PilA